MYHALGIEVSEELANTLGNLSNYAYSVEGNCATALEYGVRAYAMLQTILGFGGKSKLTGNICATLASIARHSGDIASAREYSQCALEASLALYGGGGNGENSENDDDNGVVHEDIAMAYNSLGMNEYADQRYDEAARYFETALRMCQRYWGEHTPHPQFVDLYINLGGVARFQHRATDAREYFMTALHILKALGMPESHPNVQVCIASLSALDCDEEEGYSCGRRLVCLLCCPCVLIWFLCGGCGCCCGQSQVSRRYRQCTLLFSTFLKLFFLGFDIRPI